MRRRALGRSGLQVSVLGLGTLTFGPGVGLMAGASTPEAEALGILDRALERGVNLLDTADVYQEGESERIVGRWLRDRRCRDQVVLATKVGGAVGPGAHQRGLGRAHLRRACEDSLRRLQVEVIDLYQAHWPDTAVAQRETLQALTELRQEGKIRVAGCSNFPAWYLAQALGVSAQEQLLRYECLQPQYSLAVRHIEREILPLCRDQEVGVICWGALGNGLLSGKYLAGRRLPAHHARLASWQARWASPDPAAPLRLAQELRQVAAARGCPPAAVALAWVGSRPGVTATLVGVRTLAQLEQDLAAADLLLGDEELARLDRSSAMPPDYPTTPMNRLLAGGSFWD